MVIGIKDLSKLFAITVVSCCAVFVCALFLNYNLDLAGIENKITMPQGQIVYKAQMASGKVVAGVSGGCLIATTVVMLIFYVKNYIDSHGKELGVLKALGYSRFRVAKHFWIFGVSVWIGAVFGFAGAAVYMPSFYAIQNSEGALPELLPQFHPLLVFCLLLLPTAFFMLLAVLYAFFKMKRPAVALLKEAQNSKVKISKKEERENPFLTDLRKNTLKSRKILVFFIAFSAFCFSAMTQMAMSMKKLSSDSFSWMMLFIGLILAFMTLFMSLTSVIKANTKTIAMMKVFGYSESECAAAVFGGYRPVSYVGFAIGTAYQYFLLRIMVDVIFADFGNIPAYSFDRKGLVISLAAFVAAYEIILYLYGRKITKLPIKSVMQE